MVGIYKITNLKTGEVYIGQSKDVRFRCIEHIRHKDSRIDKAIQEFGIENFSFDSLFECQADQLDYYEEYFIKLYQSTESGYGYNVKPGGQHCKGESNANSKLTAQEVYNIREAYNNHERKFDVYELYKDKVTSYSFSNIWEGQSWQDVHMDVYTEDNINYYKRGTSIGEMSAVSVFTDEEVLSMREMYVNHSAKEIYETVKDRCSFQTLQQILCGRYYSHLAIYDKKNKRWIVKN